MYRSPVWIGFLTLIAVATAWFGTKAIDEVYDYQSLSKQIPATITGWSVKKLSGSRFAPQATYTFTIGGKPYEGTTLFDHHTFRNEWATEADITNLSKKNWNVWYNPDKPTESTLDRYFPYSSCLSGVLMLGIFIYFLVIGRYIAGAAD